MTEALSINGVEKKEEKKVVKKPFNAYKALVERMRRAERVQHNQERKSEKILSKKKSN